MASTVHVSGISHETSEKEVKDFFSFCGKITSLSITPASSEANAEKSATVTFEKETAAKTALLLDNTQLGKSQVKVTSANSIDDVATKAGSAATGDDQTISQEDKPRSRIIAEYLAHGYTISDNVVQRAIDLDQKHGFSNRFTAALTDFDSKYKATDKAKEMDSKYKVTDKAWGIWGGLNSYFEKAIETPTGQKLRDFYIQGDKQVRDVHNEARRLADIKSGKNVYEPHEQAGGQTTCGCGGENATCGCAAGKCNCANCPKSEKAGEQPPYSPTDAKGIYQPVDVKGTEKSVCSCGGSDGVCGCPPGKCACSSCSKSSVAATTEAKEAAQASGQKLPANSV